MFVLGHSLGLSDRTLLNTIFEHEKCKRVKLFYYKKDDQTDDFEEKVINASRNFKDKARMRKIIVNKASSSDMNQYR